MHRRSSELSQGGALVALVAPPLYVDDPPGPFDPPQARITIPGGLAAQEAPPTVLELFWTWLQARIGPPTG